MMTSALHAVLAGMGVVTAVGAGTIQGEGPEFSDHDCIPDLEPHLVDHDTVPLDYPVDECDGEELSHEDDDDLPPPSTRQAVQTACSVLPPSLVTTSTYQ